MLTIFGKLNNLIWSSDWVVDSWVDTADCLHELYMRIPIRKRPQPMLISFYLLLAYLVSLSSISTRQGLNKIKEYDFIAISYLPTELITLSYFIALG